MMKWIPSCIQILQRWWKICLVFAHIAFSQDKKELKVGTKSGLGIQLGGEVDLIIDGGRVSGMPSTVIDMLRKPPVIIRRGMITEEMIREIIGHVKVI